MKSFHAATLAALWFAPAVYAAPAATTKPALVDYVVQPGDSCHSIAVKRYGDARRVDLIHANNALGPAPHHLKPGTHLQLPPAVTDDAGGPDAQLTFVRNQVEAYTPDEHAGTRNEELHRGNRVATLAASSAEVTFVDETQLQLGEHTLVVILGQSSSEAQSHAGAEDTTLLSGSLRAHLGELVGRPSKSLATPAGRVTLGAGEAQVAVDDKRSTRLAVYRGRGKLRAKGREVEVPDGFGSKAEEGRAPTPPRPLPAAPVWPTPFPALALAVEGTADVAGDYAAGAGAGPPVAQWHVQLARDDKFNDLVTDVQVPADVTRLAARALVPGRYWVRVAGIDADHFEGKAGPTATLQVAPVKVVAPHGASDGTLELPAGLACTIDGAPATATPAPGKHVLACTLAASDATAATPSATTTSPTTVTTAPATPAPAMTTIIIGAGTPSPKPAPPKPVAPVAPPPPPPPPAPRMVGWEIAGAIGFGVTHHTAGPQAAFELGLRLGFEDTQLALALRGAAESYPSLQVDAGALSLPLTLRLARVGAPFTPYVGFLPEVLFIARSQPSPSSIDLQLGGILGAHVKLPDGQLFIELQYRHAVWQRDDSQASNDGFLMLIGWRGDL